MHLRLKIASLFASFGLLLSLGLFLPESQLALLWAESLVLGAVSLLVILLPQLRQISGWFIVGGGVLVWVLYKFLFTGGVLSGGSAYYAVFVVEAALVVLIGGLAYRISSDLQFSQMGDEVLKVAVDLLPELDSAVGREIVKQQMARCREAERPLSIVLFNPLPPPTEAGAKTHLPIGLIQALQKSRLADLIRSELPLADRIVLRAPEERMLVVCPMIDAPEAGQLGTALCDKALQVLGFCPTFAVTAFPANGLTFNKILEEAGVALDRQPVADRKIANLAHRQSNLTS